MVKAPTCKVCGKPHWSTEPHAWDVEKVPIPQKVVVATGGTVKWSEPQSIGNFNPILTVEEAKERFPPAPKFDKRAYQREYMRKRRAKSEPR